MTTTARPVLRAALESLIDYAGLFPPASLGLPSVIDRFAAYREGAFAWMLGRLVVPAGQLDELAALCPWQEGAGTSAWRLAVLGGVNPARDLARVAEFNARHRPRACADVFEARVGSPEDVRRLAASCVPGVRLVCEVPRPTGVGALLDATAGAGAVAKLRAGGVVADAFPSLREVASFLLETARRDLPIKVTAGLHHAVRGEYRLTYEPGAPCGTMHGFLNLLCAAAWVTSRAPWAPAGPGGATDADVPGALVAILERRDSATLRSTDAGLSWGGESIDAASLGRARSASIVAIGSCSFDEPVAELRQLGFL